MAGLEARPTEYRGVRFRSKCEAMFALWLDLDCQAIGGMEEWDYEPELTFMPGFSCDFHLYSLVRENGRPPGLHHSFIEYKPSKPTQTYADNFFASYVKAVIECDTRGLQCVSRESSAIIYFGSFFSKERGRLLLDGPDVVCLDETDWLKQYEDNIRSYRFDLVSQAS